MTTSAEAVWAALEDLADPEIPVISLRDLGILRDVRSGPDGLEVVITPTYSGCPAMSQIEDDVRSTLENKGISARVVTQLAPAWTTDWMTAAGREKLARFGIAPPGERAENAIAPLRFIRAAPRMVACPHCGATDTERLAEFGSTACKALYRCRECREPFDCFKPI
jgi:ring-1,2-phenylacetyl-CoA epoxidase subunit PaaD